MNVDLEWKEAALKYDCATKLSTRFRPCFGRDDESRTANRGSASSLGGAISVECFPRIKVTPSSIPNEHLPCSRCAHNMVTLQDGSILLFAGDSDADRLSDVWKLSTPNEGWDIDLDLFDNETAPRLGHSPVWERLQCSSVADEDVPTPLSNSAAVVCGNGDETAKSLISANYYISKQSVGRTVRLGEQNTRRQGGIQPWYTSPEITLNVFMNCGFST